VKILVANLGSTSFKYRLFDVSHPAEPVLARRADIKVISCHLGGSSSLAAIRNGKSVACSLGMSPQSGLPHNNRVGDFDVFVLPVLLRETGKSLDEILEILSWPTDRASRGCAWPATSATSSPRRPAASARTRRGSARACAAISTGSASRLTLSRTPTARPSAGFPPGVRELRSGPCRPMRRSWRPDKPRHFWAQAKNQ